MQKAFAPWRRAPIQCDDEYVVRLSFLSVEPGKYRVIRVPLARRIADRGAPRWRAPDWHC